MVTLGVDLAAEPKGTALCELRWSRDGATVAEIACGAADATILCWAARAAAVGVDAPFGWPLAFERALAAWADGLPWPGRWERDRRERLRLRETDRWVAQRGKRPLSVSTDKIAVCAMRAATLLTAQAADGPALSRVEGPWFEVYPGGALHEWGLGAAASGYKRDPAVRERLLALLVVHSRGRLALAAKQRERCVRSDHALDALLCALVARAAAIGRTFPPPPSLDAETVAREGWIHLPDAPLDALADPGGAA